MVEKCTKCGKRRKVYLHTDITVKRYHPGHGDHWDWPPIVSQDWPYCKECGVALTNALDGNKGDLAKVLRGLRAKGL